MNKNETINHKRKKIMIISSLIIIGIIIGIFVSLFTVQSAIDKAVSIDPSISMSGIGPMIGTIFFILNIILLIALIIVYFNVYRVSKSRYIIGIIFISIAFLVKNIFSIFLLELLTYLSATDSLSSLFIMDGNILTAIGILTMIVSVLELIGISILLYLSLE